MPPHLGFAHRAAGVMVAREDGVGAGKTQEPARFVAGLPEKDWRGPDKWIHLCKYLPQEAQGSRGQGVAGSSQAPSKRP